MDACREADVVDVSFVVAVAGMMPVPKEVSVLLKYCNLFIMLCAHR